MLIHAILIVVGVTIQVFLPGFPKEILLLESGLLFGVIGGTLVNWSAMIIAAQVGYEVVRHSVETGSKLSSILYRYQHWHLVNTLNQRGNHGLFLIRLIPNAPNDLLSLLSGGLLLPRRGFFLVSVVTALPYAFILAYFGSIGNEFINPANLLWGNLIVFTFWVFLASVYYLWKYILSELQL